MLVIMVPGKQAGVKSARPLPPPTKSFAGWLQATRCGVSRRRHDGGTGLAGTGASWMMTSQSEFRVTGVSWKKGVKDDFADIGGTVNQVADDRYLQVGVSGSGRLWYRTSYCGYNVWYPG